MPSPRLRAGLTLALVYVYAALLCAGVPGCNTAAANTAATANTQTTLKPLLQAVATAHPEQAAAVNALLANWTTQGERADYNAALPLLAVYQADNPSMAGLVKDKLYTWDKRLTAMGQ